MKYSLDIDINAPLDLVIELFDDLETMKLWQKGFISYKHLDGEPGKIGAKTELNYDMGNRKINMIETIKVRNLPEEFSAIYEAKGVWNEVNNYFVEVDANTTKWTTENEFRFTTFFMKIMGFMMPRVFKKQSYKYLVDFKNFVENYE